MATVLFPVGFTAQSPSEVGSDVGLAPGESVTILELDAPVEVYTFTFKFSSDEMELIVTLDDVETRVRPSQLAELNFFEPNNQTYYLLQYDVSNSEYTITYTPSEPLRANKRFYVRVVNRDTSNAQIIRYAISYRIVES